jgi:translocation and assembly module TamA
MPKLFVFLSMLSCLTACSYIPFLNKEESKNGNGEQKIDEPRVIIEVIGVDSNVADNIRAHVGISKNNCTTSTNLLKRRNKKTLLEANSALQAFGFYEAKIDINYDEINECSQATFSIQSGKQMPVSQVDIVIDGAANTDPDFQKLTSDLAIKQGHLLNHKHYSETKASIESVAAELGYLDGRFIESRLTVDMEKYEARVFLKYNSGERYKLGKVVVKQEPEFLYDTFIHRLLEVPEGHDYSAFQVVDIQNRLLASDYFKSVEARPRLSNSEDRTIPVDVYVRPNDRHHFQASMGFATDEGLRSKLGYTNRWWNPRGHRLGAETKLSQSELGVSANYQVPRRHPSNEWLQISTGFRQQSFDTYDNLSADVTVSESKRRPWAIMENRFISFSRDDFEIGNEKGIARFLIPGARWSRRLVDDEVFTKHGLDLNFELRGATDAIISDTNFLRGSFHAHYLRALPLDFRAFVRGDLGGTWVDDFRALPPSERFFAGGDNSIRGYDFQELGPINATGHVIGGPYLGVMSFEIEKYLTDKWGIATFVDSGNAFGGPGKSTGLKTGVGLGLRWRSPVGAIRVDLAHPLDDDDTLLKLHLRIGPEL